MQRTIDRDGLVERLRRAAALVRAESDTLSRLDSFGGDGDHGTTMARAMDQLERAIDDDDPGDLPALLKAIGWAILGVDGGATGPLLGSFFTAMSAAVDDQELDACALAAAAEAGLEGVRKQTRAQPGDKTLLDALVPAVAALRATAEADGDVETALDAAATAAEVGALTTVDMRPRFGRAKHVADQSVGHADPGATSMALLFRGLAKRERADGG